MHTLEAIIPAPAKIRKEDRSMPISRLQTFAADGVPEGIVSELTRVASYFGISIRQAEDAPNLLMKITPSIGSESWRICVSPTGVLMEAGDRNGMLYAVSAFSQMLIIALIKGPEGAVLDCGTVCDNPRFAWRGFMLDSARHFQKPETIKAVIRLMAHFRLNTFHWHLTDDSGWRIASKRAPGLSSEQYTLDDLRRIAEFASSQGIRIVPEIDIPGHSAGILAAYPQYNCDPVHPGKEFCIGNPETKNFLKQIYGELLQAFPESHIIHLGGDEAETSHWEKCPRCNAAAKANGCRTMRELENQFMTQMTRFIAEQGRSPMIWGTCSGQTYHTDTIIQSWLDIREPLRIAPHGNKIVYSVHNSLYFDYPDTLSEPHETWMFELSDKGVYMTDPYIIWADKVKDAILGTEACLWTETVPEWRVIRKILPRLAAYSECAWSLPEKKEWFDFLRRKEQLCAAGYNDFLLKDIFTMYRKN